MAKVAISLKKIFCILSVLELMSCKIEQPDNLIFAWELLNDRAQGQCSLSIKDFRFSSSANRLNQDYLPRVSLTRDTEEIQIHLPYGSLSRAIPYFELEGDGSLFLGGVRQESGVTSTDFSESKRFELVGSSGNSCNRSIQVSVLPITPVVDTGVRFCYDQSAVLPDNPTSCSDPSNAFRQDGVWTDVPNPRAWSDPEQITNDAGIVRDRLTGIVWRKCARGQNSATNCSGTPLLNTLADAKSFCSDFMNDFDNGNGYGGFKNWRLPTVHELSNLIDYSKNNTDGLVDPNSFPNAVVTGADYGYWSEQSWKDDENEAWRVRFVFDSGIETIKTHSKTGQARMVRCVSSTHPPTKRWSDSGEGVIRDEIARLSWEKCIAGQTLIDGRCDGTSFTTVDWQDALKTCQVKGEGWRLPNVNELFSLYNYNLRTPGLDLDVFLGAPSVARYWTSTTVPSDTSMAFYQDPLGTLQMSSKVNNHMFRCVRTSVD